MHAANWASGTSRSNRRSSHDRIAWRNVSVPMLGG
jgi:hypothetical protein